MCTHVHEKKPEKPIHDQVVAGALIPVRIRKEYTVLFKEYSIRLLTVFAVHVLFWFSKLLSLLLFFTTLNNNIMLMLSYLHSAALTYSFVS